MVLYFPAPQPPPTTVSGRWDSPSSLCQVTHGRHINASLLQKYTDRLKTVIPSPDKFEPNYKTPCWHTYLHISEQIQNMLYKAGRQKLRDRDAAAIMSSIFSHASSKSLVCIPQVFFVGFPRSGSTQLYKMLIRHPHIKGGINKEPHWWTRHDYSSDFPHDVLNVVRYISFFQDNFKYMERNKNTVLVDGSQSTIWDTRSICFLPQLISDLLPHAKFIVLMRDPVERLYSDFNYLCEEMWRKKGIKAPPKKFQTNRVQIFHERTLEQLEAMKHCLMESSLELCTYDSISDSSTSVCDRVRLGISLYHVHIKRWLRVLPRKHFLFLTTDELAANPLTVLQKVWDFLGMAKQNVHEVEDILHEHLHGSQAHQTSMRHETEKELKAFFQPHNVALATLLGDDRFKWS